MRRLKHDRVVSVDASSYDANFDESYLIDDFPGRVWKSEAGKHSASITLVVEGGCSDIWIFNTNAESVSAFATGTNRAYWADQTTWADSTIWAQGSQGVTRVYTAASGSAQPVYEEDGTPVYEEDGTVFNQEGGPSESLVSTDGRALSVTALIGGGNIHIQLASTIGPCIVRLVLTASGAEVYAGKVAAGISETYGGAGVRYGLGTSFVDRSIQSEHPRYYTKRITPKSWGVSLLLTNAEAVQFVDDFDTYGSENNAWRLANLSLEHLICYGYAHSPAITHNNPNHANVSFTLQEVK